MLSPHELSALMLIQNHPDPHALNPADLDALIDQRLVRLETQARDRQYPRLTRRGHDVLDAIRRIR